MYWFCLDCVVCLWVVVILPLLTTLKTSLLMSTLVEKVSSETLQIQMMILPKKVVKESFPCVKESYAKRLLPASHLFVSRAFV